jgi:hypothetical protein
MSSYDITSQVTEILASGMTIEQVEARTNPRGYLHMITMDGDRLVEALAPNRAGEQAADELLEEVRAKAAANQPRKITAAAATDRQVEYLIALLSRKHRADEHDGFVSWEPLITDDDEVDVKALRALTRDRASQLITSLKGNY